MFQEDIADATAVHLRSHIIALLQAVQTRHQDTVRLLPPKRIETANLVGGVYNAILKDMPAYAIDIIEKAFAGTSEGLWLYDYRGHIAGIAAGNDEASVNKLIKRHEEAVEGFVRTHYRTTGFLNPSNGDYSIIELIFLGAGFSGAELIDEKDNTQTWIAGFRVDLQWVTSEQGPGDHA